MKNSDIFLSNKNVHFIFDQTSYMQPKNSVTDYTIHSIYNDMHKWGVDNDINGIETLHNNNILMLKFMNDAFLESMYTTSTNIKYGKIFTNGKYKEKKISDMRPHDYHNWSLSFKKPIYMNISKINKQKTHGYTRHIDRDNEGGLEYCHSSLGNQIHGYGLN